MKHTHKKNPVDQQLFRRLNSTREMRVTIGSRIRRSENTPGRLQPDELLEVYHKTLDTEGRLLGRQVYQLLRSLPREEHDQLQHRLLNAWEQAREALGKSFNPQVNGDQARHLCTAFRAILSVGQQGYEAGDGGFLSEDQLAKMEQRTRVIALTLAAAYQTQFGGAIPLDGRP